MLSTDLHLANGIQPADRTEMLEISSLIAAAFEPFRGKTPDEVIRLYIERSCNVVERWDKGQVLVLDRSGRIDAAASGWDPFRRLHGAGLRHV